MSDLNLDEPVATVERIAKPAATESAPGVRIGTLVGLAENGTVPLVVYEGQPGTAAIRTRTVPDLSGRHIGLQVVLLFEDADLLRPIVVGCLQPEQPWPLADPPAEVEIDADGRRLVVTARQEIVLRCGLASITLTRAGKVLIQGTYVLTRSSGVNRVKGGSVQIN